MLCSHTSEHDVVLLTVLLEYVDPLSLIGRPAEQASFATPGLWLDKFNGY